MSSALELPAATRTRIAPRWEKVFVVIVLLLATHAVIPLLREESRMGGDFAAQGGDPVALIIWAGIYATGILLLIQQPLRRLTALFRDRVLWLLLALPFASIAWSVAPTVTFKQSVGLLGASILGGYLAIQFSRRELLQMLIWALAIGTVLSLVVTLFIPSLGISTTIAAEGWRGIYQNKNHLGHAMALSIIVLFLYLFDQHRYRFLGSGIIVLSTALLLLSTSKTPLVVLATLLILLPTALAARSHSILAVSVLMFTLAIAGGIVVLLVSNLDSLLDILGRDITLTGRTELWAVVWEMIRQRPWQGYGYGAFWLGMSGYSLDVYRMIHWLPAHAHNGFLDLWLDLGIAGPVLFIISFFGSLWRSLVVIRHEHSMTSTFPLVFLMFLFLSNLPESDLLTFNSIYWVLYVAIALSLRIDNRSQDHNALTEADAGVSAGPVTRQIEAAERETSGQLLGSQPSDVR